MLIVNPYKFVSDMDGDLMKRKDETKKSSGEHIN